MVSPQTHAPPAGAPVAKRRAPTPQRLQKRKLTLAQAADQWEAAKRETERQKALVEEAAEVLDAYFDRTKRHTYKDRIARVSTGGGLILDQPKVRAYLGARLRDFQTTTKLGWTLKLLR
jgi:hypothetical protein